MKRLVLVLVLGGLAIAAALTGCAGSSNSTACKLYESAYNDLADAIQAKNAGQYGATVAMIRSAQQKLPARFDDAFGKATNDVAVEISRSRDAAVAAGDWSSQDAAVGFLLTTTDVADACAADGATISMHPFK